MASTSQGQETSVANASKAQDETVEMSTLQPPSSSSAEPVTTEVADTPTQQPSTEIAEQHATAGAEQPSHPEPSSSQPQPPPPAAVRLNRAQSEALGPATESTIAPPPPTTERGPTLSITLMLTSGARHPYKIDEKYLRNRKVEIPEGTDFDPREISGYKLKELIWTDWRSEWEARPASPSAIRLILLGRFVEDKTLLKDLPFKMTDTNVVHMTVKPADFLEDEDHTGKTTGKGSSIRGRDGEDRGAGCRCVIL